MLIKEFSKNLQLAGGEIIDKNNISNYFNSYEIKAKFGVAENGALFIENPTKELFLSENIKIIIDKKEIYPTMEDIMEFIDEGIFISGPSKTADVESFLVLGAHGAIKVGVVLI